IKKLAEGILTIRQRLEELYRQLVFKGSELEQLQSKLGVLTKNEEYWSKEFISWVNKAGASNEELKQLNLEIIAANIVIRSITNDINRIQARINALSSFQEGSVVPQGLGDLLGLLAVRRFELSVKQNRLANLISQHGC
ncbi:MAG: hypothetical protein KJ722_02165, partial [Candidatus Omnitrophica bacterium]|nr:hypothetical protein [Candidatus Omnitrophota bacterium]